MKKIELLLVFLFMLLFSCVDENSLNPDKETDPEKIKQAESFITTVNYQVPVVDGHITTLSFNGMTLARTSTPINIKVPKDAVSRSNNNLNIEYTEGVAAQPFSNLWQTIMFEDSKQGDFDYNDLVIHANYQIQGDKLTVSIHPIALGSSKNIKLRFKVTQGSHCEVVKVAENCREELFNGLSGYINTETYDIHFDDFKKTYTLDLANSTDIVDVSWFINLSDNELIYAVNQNGDICINKDGMPYGFALTDVSANSYNTQSNKYATSVKSENEEAWKTIIPDVSSWAKMPTLPTIPSKALSMSKYDPEDTDDEANYVLYANDSYKGKIALNEDANYYIQGALTLDGFVDDEDNCTIYIMPGATLNINTDALQYAKIVNYGNIVWNSKYPKMDNGFQLYTNQVIDVPLYLQINSNVTFYAQADVILSELIMTRKSRNSRIYAASITAEKVEMFTTSLLYVPGSVSTALFKTNGGEGATAYIGCKLLSTTEAILDVNADIYVKGYVNTPKLTYGNQVKLYVASDAVVRVQEFIAKNLNQNRIITIGSAPSLIELGVFNGNSVNLSSFFNGAMDVIVGTWQKNGKKFTLKDSGVKLPDAPVVFDDMNLSIPQTECSPGFNSSSQPSDNGIGWFAYPQEHINISKCYNFDKWQQGIFDFTLLPDALVFDINSTSPTQGGKYKIYQLKK